MDIHPYQSSSKAAKIREDERDLMSQLNRAHNLMIPVQLDEKNQVFGYFVVDSLQLPVGGQKHLNEITGTPFKAGLSGMTVFAGTIQPDLQKNYINALMMLADSIDRCDESAHSQNTAFWSHRLAVRMGLPNNIAQEIRLAGKLHDIGKAVVPREILTKPGPLSKEEWDIIKRHPAYGAALMEPSFLLMITRELVIAHHEHYDGSGYPNGLDGEKIPIGARILSVADAFSTMTIRRAYRAPISIDAAVKELLRCRGSQFDPKVVDYMVKVIRGE